MAKKHTDDGTVTVNIPSGLVLKYGAWEIPAADASPATLAYCLQNGFHQSMVDAAAFSKEEKEGKTEAEVEAMATEKRQARFDNIVAGTVGHRAGGPRVRGVDKIVRDVALERLTAVAAAKGKALPKGKGAAEKVNKLVDLYLSDEGRAADCRAEAERRHASATAEGDFDLDAVA